jgi:DNA-binding GntR family transcriptional regulator
MTAESNSNVVALSDPGLMPVTKDSLTQKAYDRIRTALMAGQFVPGQRLVLRRVAAELGISPTPVREALLRLVSENALALDPRGVASVPHLDPITYKEVRDLRIELEGNAAVAAVERFTEEDLSDLQRLHNRLINAEARGDTRAAFMANEMFHMKLYKCAGMPVLLSLIESLWMRCGPLFVLLQGQGYVFDPARHDVIIMGLRDRDSAAVRRGVKEDIMAGWAALMGE